MTVRSIRSSAKTNGTAWFCERAYYAGNHHREDDEAGRECLANFCEKKVDIDGIYISIGLGDKQQGEMAAEGGFWSVYSESEGPIYH